MRIIQIDEAALREGLRCAAPNGGILELAVNSFRIAADGVADETQIHTHCHNRCS